MKNRVLLTAATLAAMTAQLAQKGTSLASRLLDPIPGDQTGTNDPRPPRINRRRGYSAAQGKRAARKRRNILRARGHHRQAVR